MIVSRKLCFPHKHTPRTTIIWGRREYINHQPPRDHIFTNASMDEVGFYKSNTTWITQIGNRHRWPLVTGKASVTNSVSNEQRKVTTLLEKRSFVPVGNPHWYRVSNRYKPSYTNEVEDWYRARYPVQMWYRVESRCWGIQENSSPSKRWV
jgi:hypothetical protein